MNNLRLILMDKLRVTEKALKILWSRHPFTQLRFELDICVMQVRGFAVEVTHSV